MTTEEAVAVLRRVLDDIDHGGHTAENGHAAHAALDTLERELSQRATQIENQATVIATERTALTARIAHLESQLAARPALEWKPAREAKLHEQCLFALPVVSNGEPSTDYWVDSLEEESGEDDAVYHELESGAWMWADVVHDGLCIPLSALALPPAPKPPEGT